MPRLPLLGDARACGILRLAHLAEVDARGAYRLWAAPTLQAYCVYELRYSEDEAQRRCRAARLVREFPRLLDMLADSSLHLTGLLMVGPHLTPDNESELLGRVAFRTKREIERILAEVAPRPDAPSLIQPLGPAGDGAVRPAPSTWQMHVRGLAGFERQLPPGMGPGDAPGVPSGEVDEMSGSGSLAERGGRGLPSEREGVDSAAEREGVDSPAEPPPSTPSAMRYRLQFTADQSFVELLSEARDLLWHQLPDGDLATVHRLALEALVGQLRRGKYAATGRRPLPGDGAVPGRSRRSCPEDDAAPARSGQTSSNDGPAAPARDRRSLPDDDAAPSRAGGPSASPAEAAAPAGSRPLPVHSSVRSPSAPGGARARLPAALRRDVWQRDGGRCTFVDVRGVRCRSTAALEFHHGRAHALGGLDTRDNITLRCRAHNRLAEERDFGSEYVAVRAASRDAPRP